MRRTLRAVFAGLLLFSSPAALQAAPTQGDVSAAYEQNTDQDFRVGMQMRLAWTGDYVGPFDGRIGPRSIAAIKSFQGRMGQSATGVMDAAFLDALIGQSDNALRSVGFGWQDDSQTGVRLGLPFELVQEVGATEVGTMWRSPDEALEIETVRFVKEGYSLQDVFDILSTPTDGKVVEASELKGDRFRISGREGDRDYVISFQARGGDLRGFSVAYPKAMETSLKPYLVVAEGGFDPFAGEPASQAPDTGPMAELSRDPRYALAFTNNGIMRESATGGERASDAPSGLGGYDVGGELDASGSGFVVSNGWVLTNAHVARTCRSVAVGSFGTASKVVVDDENDLALLKVDADLGRPLPLVTGKPRLGEDVLALGYPLRSILADSLNVTRGNISSLLGLMNDPNYLQISAAVQPGNSGGPVIDLAGRVVGIVTAKLNAVAVADITGDIPQSINFAIRPDVAARFLDENGIAFVAADMDAALETVPDATEKTADSVVPVLCLGTK
ncbi:trypsin-like peptidase domain-containing protein [Aureimonas sp. OT7]|uniref:serine protease n=1 Tax=Aureimonas sp. OT7 TaxID=2816454 RepID=UPI00177D8642|nr:serine protease [Aureimonas sp. OT7]QOG08072.1 trypsin-like peptidase domain-containing protein [Aureimonas sp. OT7]